MKTLITNLMLLLAVTLNAQNSDVIKFKEKGKWGIKDSTGKVLVKPKYSAILEIKYGIAIVDNYNTTKEYHLVAPGQQYSTYREVHRKWPKIGCVNISNGKEIISAKHIEVKVFKNNLIAVRKGVGKWINYDHKGKRIKPDKYISFDEQEDRGLKEYGLIYVKSPEEKVGYIDTLGYEIIPVKYDYIDHIPTKKEIINVKVNSKWGCLDSKTFKEIIPAEYEYTIIFKENIASARRDNKSGYIDKKNNVVIPFMFELADSFSEGLARVKQDGKWGAIDKEQNIVIPFVYDNLESFSEGLAIAKTGDKFGVIDKKNNIVIPIIYEEAAKKFSEGLLNVKKDGKWGFIDKANNVVIPFIYEEHSIYKDTPAYFEGGITTVVQGDLRFYINKKGERVNAKGEKIIEKQ